MNEEQLSQMMGRIAEKAVPDGSSIWDKIEASYKAEAKIKRMPQRWNWAAVFVAVFAAALLTTGGALAYILLTNFPTDPGAKNVAESGLGIALNESRTVNGVTINLLQGYADSERVLLFYTIEGIDPTRFNHRDPEAELSEIYNFGGVDQHQTFDGLHYQYRLDENRVLLVSSFNHEATADTVDFSWQLIINNLGEVAPPEFHFEISLPIQQSLLIPVYQTIDVEGFEVTLESIESSAASTKVRICSTLPDAYDHIDFNDLGLLIDGELYPYVYGTEVNTRQGQHFCMEQSFEAGILTGTESVEVTFSGFFIAPDPSQADIDNALAELSAEGIQAEINLVDGRAEWQILSYPEGYNAEVWLYSTLYTYRQINFNHSFSINLSEIVLSNR
jgi:hypothetical protein